MSWLSWIIDSLSEKVIYRISTPFNQTLEVVKSGNKLILNTKSVNYSYGGLHSAFRQLFRKIRIENLNVRNVLILGFGAGSVASILQYEYRLECKITGVEIDPEVLRIGKKFFNINEFKNLELIEQDAFHFMLNNNETYNVVVVDLYIDKDVPVQAETSEFVSSIKKSLKPEGQLIFNKWVYNKSSGESGRRLENVINETFGNLRVYRTGHNRMNRILVSSRND